MDLFSSIKNRDELLAVSRKEMDIIIKRKAVIHFSS